MKLSAEEAGFGCDEGYSTSFFYMATFGDDKISRPIGLERGKQGALEDSILSERYPDGSVKVRYYTYINFVEADLPPPDTATYYLQNLFTGATFSTDVPAKDNGPPRKTTALFADYGELGLGAVADVVTAVVYKREGVEVTNHCLSLTDDTLP
jgi:hypothetical protein